MEDFHDHYLKDLLLLANVFGKFIFTCFKYYDVDPCHYFIVPKFSWDAMLKMTGVTLQKISDLDKCIFLNKELVISINVILKHLKMLISFIWTWAIYMDAQWDNICLLIILNGSKT